MQHRLSHLRLAMAHRRCAPLFSWFPACLFGLTLAACGGGGGGGADISGADGGAAGAGGAGGTTSAGTFIAAAGPLCAKRAANNHCVQPTSSSTTPFALMKAITDPNGQVIDFDSMGSTMNYAVTFKGTPPGPEYTYTSYGMARRNIQAGRNTFTVDDRYYGNARAFPAAGEIKYRHARDDATVTFNVGRQKDQNDENLSSLTLSEDQASGGGGRAWSSALRLLTDQTDAPPTPTITYVGRVLPSAGSAALLDEHTRDFLITGVTYEAVLNTVTGTLTGVSIDYTESKSQRHTRLELPELRFQNSQLDSASRQQRIHARMEGPGQDDRGDEPQPDTARTRHEFTTDGLEGEITGRQAEIIELVGGGPKGILHVALVRKDLTEDDFVIDIPRPKP
ncbi:hypothetical protein [Verminephrobacter eiseniae]|uniref:Lipoprotein n=2 Tax=Verminephrobacter eiseniae TaxID=364317 RepID=A1WEI5_VEREI|nr:hypothetical protein [Verminephrobacter eiseniae]ABM56042.1 hypothetical protein Veis_0251 [Verminephrobacter eiseniae EF01-2]